DLSANRTISVDTSQSVAGHALVTHYELNSADTVGTLTKGVWNATSIDTTYANSVSRIVTGTGMAHTVKGKTDSLYVSGVPLTSVTISTNSPLSGGGDLSANRTISVATSQSVP